MAKIAVVLTTGFADWEYALIAGTGGPFYGLDVRFFTPDGGDLTSQGGLRVVVSEGMNELVTWGPDVVVVVGGTVWETDGAPDLSHVLNGLYEKGATIGGICGGTLALARAGLLDRVAHTSNDPAFLTAHAAGYCGAALYQARASAVSHDRVITAPGTAPASFTAAVFEAAGVPVDVVAQFKGMMAAEHG